MYIQTAMNTYKVIAYNHNITHDQPVINEIIIEEPNIKTIIEIEGEYKVSYPPFWLQYMKHGNDLKGKNMEMMDKDWLISDLIKKRGMLSKVRGFDCS